MLHLATTEHLQGQQNSRGAPTGARFLLFLSEWQKLGAKAVIEQSMRLFWIDKQSKNRLMKLKAKREFYGNMEQVSKLREIVNQEFKDHVIEEVSNNQVLFYNLIFCVPKKKGKWRKILDCRIFNRPIQVQSFKMEGVREIKDLLQQGDYATSLDLHQAYHHIAVPIQIRPFLAFYFEK
ncbi:MAG: hypothetical protein EZS28_044726, partial [Streblomastix strix]